MSDAEPSPKKRRISAEPELSSTTEAVSEHASVGSTTESMKSSSEEKVNVPKTDNDKEIPAKNDDTSGSPMQMEATNDSPDPQQNGKAEDKGAQPNLKLEATADEPSASKLEVTAETQTCKDKKHESKVAASDTSDKKDEITDTACGDSKPKPADKPISATKPTSMTEEQAGITEYMGDHSGFSAIIKQRYSDFVVHEIDLEGNTVHLTGMDPPKDEETESQSPAVTSQDKQSVVTDEITAELETLSKSSDKSGKVNIPAPEEKEKRTQIHLMVKRTFPEFETKTVEEDGNKFIQVVWKKWSSFKRSSENQWPAAMKSHPYVKFVLYKENKDTIDAIGLIAKNLRVKEGLFQFAGTKDRRGKTSQEITAHKIHPKKLARLNTVLYNMGLGNFRYVKEPLKLGQLQGNHFTIVLRNVQGSTSTVDKALTSLKDNGFINYFGLQRFGTTSVPTHDIGRALLKGEWQSAIDLILMPKNDHPDKDKFQQIWAESRDPEATLRALPRYCGLERNLLEGLKKKMSLLNALERISRNTRLLYVHSYQSWVWNQMVSRRLKQLGHDVIIGDLVMGKKGSADQDPPKPTVVTADNIKDFSLHDVVLPMPGHDVIYPHSEVGEWYKQALEKDGLDIVNMKRPQKDYSLPGAYRHITVFPTDVTWRQCFYDDFTLPLTHSDLDKLKGEVTAPELRDHGKLKAVVLELSLPQSCYATMALRELLREDTSHGHQTSLNVT